MLQIFNYNDNNITFKNEEGIVYANASEMAKPFGKLPASYLRNDSTKEFLTALSSTMQISIDGLVITKEGGNGGGTWMHEDVALDFAQWLSPKFRVWCNQRIKELLTTGKTEIPKPASNLEKIIEGWKALELEYETVKEQNKLLINTITKQAPKVEYHDKVLQSDGLININVIAKELGMSAVSLNRKLNELGVIYKSGETWVLYFKYQNLGYTKPKTFPYVDSTGAMKTSIQTCWTEKGRQFIHGLLNPTAKA